jgi:hypothetical protein
VGIGVGRGDRPSEAGRQMGSRVVRCAGHYGFKEQRGVKEKRAKSG